MLEVGFQIILIILENNFLVIAEGSAVCKVKLHLACVRREYCCGIKQIQG